MLFLRQRRINWLQWTGGARGAAGKMKAQDNVILTTTKDQLAVLDRWGPWGGGKDKSVGQCYSYDSKGSTGCGGPNCDDQIKGAVPDIYKCLFLCDSGAKCNNSFFSKYITQPSQHQGGSCCT
ncbi:hypothetical protein E2C01_023833 [Portunus trituberculatus]|uniref:Uncharacterized protein n=1 Tax=Portunus trituberculatus TaxID=210409 RepID=A0A5B7EBL3_PORTR|nr:hypothetical protein [Portunus trituberculatus]